MRKTSQQNLPSQQYQTPLSSLTPLLRFCAHNLIRCRVLLLSATLLGVTPFVGALLLQPLAHAVPVEDGDFVQSDSLLPLPKISELPRVSVTKFTARGKHGGRWRGRVFGSGPTALILRFFNGDSLVKKKLIGRVHLDSEPQGVRFSYSGTRPRTGTTHWDIIALQYKGK